SGGLGLGSRCRNGGSRNGPFDGEITVIARPQEFLPAWVEEPMAPAFRLNITISRLWIGATSDPFAVVNMMRKGAACPSRTARSRRQENALNVSKAGREDAAETTWRSSKSADFDEPQRRRKARLWKAFPPSLFLRPCTPRILWQSPSILDLQLLL
ncbi:hypothetical protein, partial [Neorhizobium galegae]|uniref:hypothetical protein n=1 Tax=Neorhizobium galegae TaxID=399 RepID=UPI002104C431